jgi:hypothetical protein
MRRDCSGGSRKKLNYVRLTPCLLPRVLPLVPAEDFEHIEASGESAGGYLTNKLSLDKRWLAAHDIDANLIASLVPLSGQAIIPLLPNALRTLDARPQTSERRAVLAGVFSPRGWCGLRAGPLRGSCGVRGFGFFGRTCEALSWVRGRGGSERPNSDFGLALATTAARRRERGRNQHRNGRRNCRTRPKSVTSQRFQPNSR